MLYQKNEEILTLDKISRNPTGLYLTAFEIPQLIYAFSLFLLLLDPFLELIFIEDAVGTVFQWQTCHAFEVGKGACGESSVTRADHSGPVFYIQWFLMWDTVGACGQFRSH